MTRQSLVKLLVLVAILASGVFAARHVGFFAYRDLETLAAAVHRARAVPGAPVLFVLAYAAVITVGLPGLPLTLAGGAIFGWGAGTLLSWVAATTGATGAFLLARLLGRDAVSGLLGKHAHRLDRLSMDRGFAAIFRLRLIPVLPFSALNFGAGLAGVRPRPFIAATALGVLPGTAIYTYFADALLSGAEGAQEAVIMRGAAAGALLVLLSFAPAIARRLGWVGPAACIAMALGGSAAGTHAISTARLGHAPGPNAIASGRGVVGRRGHEGCASRAWMATAPTWGCQVARATDGEAHDGGA